MIRFLLLLLFLVMASHSLQGQKVHYIKFRIDHKSELDSVTRMISIDDVRDKVVYAYATGEQMERFRRNTPYDIQLLPLPGNKRLKTAAISADMSGWDAYPSYGQYEAMMDSMASAYPDICELDTIGKTVLGRSLLVMRITDHPGREEDEPELFYTSTMHGNEAVGYVLMLRLIDTLLTSYGQDERITNLVDSIDIFINPNANPDGTYGHDDQTLSEASRYNANGVDLNRNFPDPQDGPHPDGQSWQPETRAMMDFAKKQHITLSANFHGGAEVANYPWDTWERSHADSSWLRHISRIYAESAQENSPEGYFSILTPSGIIKGTDWYTIYGGRQDYMTYFQQSREVTMEISDDKIPPASTLPDYWNYNREALLRYMEQCLRGIRGVVSDEWGKPLKAMVEVVGHDREQDSSMVFTDPDVGDYHRMIDTGNYDLRFSAAGYSDTLVRNIKVGREQVNRMDVVMRRIVQSVDEDGPGNRFICYPNPFQDVLHVEVHFQREVENLVIQLADAQGRIVRSMEIEHTPPGLHRFNLNTSGGSLSPGSYYIRIRAGSRTFTRKLLHLY
ncbi:MAG: T9SS type A sorting domain-containing protein [Bacteroidales bacterium]|nr:T9SS type A sorting domain-containing protein [Bacteroidales bacterium]